MNKFFCKDEVLKTLDKLSNKLETLNYTDDFEKKRTGYLRILCNSITENPELWDERCQVNINWAGDSCLYYLSEQVISYDKEELDSAFSLLFRFLLEFHLSTRNDISRNLDRVRKFCCDNISNFSDDAQNEIRYALNEMPIAIVKEIINSPEIENIKDLHSASAKFKITKDEWDENLKERESKAEKLKESLDNYKNAFNFVGLSEGFNKLADEKRQEMKDVLLWLRVVAILIIFPLVGEIIYVLSNIEKADELSKLMLLVALPTISLIAILVYYFRVLLSNYKSIQSQLLQIDLRMTLCRFINNYTEYAQEMKKQDSSSLDKFESIIFSGITSNAESIPSTFDGIEQLSKLIKAVKP